MSEIPETLLTRVKSAWPDVHADLVSLRAELAIITQKGFDGGRSLLGNDAANLAHSLEGICDFREAGVTNADVEAAEAETRTLIQDMRKRALDTIRDRSAMLRIHAETASLRADPDIKPRDLTDGFRLLAAAPVKPETAQTLAIQDTGLPAKGGPIGRVVGDFLFANAGLNGHCVDNAAPLGTFYLPPGNSVTLRKGEQVILRAQGVSFGDISLGDALSWVNDYQIEAVADGVRIYGPATLAAHEGMPVHEMLRMATEMDENAKATWWPKRIATSAEYSGNVSMGSVLILTLLMFFLIPFLILGILDKEAIRPTVIMVSLASAGVCVLGLLNAASHFIGMPLSRLFPMKKPDGDLVALDAESRRFGTGQPAAASFWRRYGYQARIGKLFKERIRSGSRLTFFAARRIVSADPEGVPVIKPLVALEAPKPEAVAPFTQAEKVTAK